MATYTYHNIYIHLVHYCPNVVVICQFGRLAIYGAFLESSAFYSWNGVHERIIKCSFKTITTNLKPMNYTLHILKCIIVILAKIILHIHIQ